MLPSRAVTKLGEDELYCFYCGEFLREDPSVPEHLRGYTYVHAGTWVCRACWFKRSDDAEREEERSK